MPKMHLPRLRVAFATAWSASALVLVTGVQAATPAAAQTSPPAHNASAPANGKPDLTGRNRVGKASFYARKFSGRKMADGNPMDPHRDNAASKTLPLGTTAKVTNLATGQSAVVTIQDRGPYVPGRIVDLSPSTAHKVGTTPQNGVATVEVAPIAVPLPDGSVKPGVAAQNPKADAR